MLLSQGFRFSKTFTRPVLKRLVSIVNFVLHVSQIDEYAMKRVSGNSTLVFIAVTNLLLSFHGLRLICFSLAGPSHSLSSYRFILIVVLLQQLTIFFL